MGSVSPNPSGSLVQSSELGMKREGTAEGGPTSAGDVQSQGRLVSLDVFRGLVIVVMTFVNYLSPVTQIPAWAKHWPENLDGYTFVDVVFPAFLFMVGLAIPFALERRIDRGDSMVALGGKILLRSAALLFLGVITANDHPYAADVALLGKPLWFLLALGCAVTVWNPCPGNATVRRRQIQRGIQVLAGIGLVVLLCLFRGKDEAGHVVWLQHSYWGMLGMIGWAYLTCGFCWLIFRDNSTALMGTLGFMLALFVGGRHGALDWLGPVQQFVNVGINFGSNSATVMMGVLVANKLRSPAARPGDRLRFMLLLGLGLYIAGSLVRPLHGINKSAHTEAYALVTGGISCLVFAGVYWLVDIQRVRRYFTVLVPLGQNALLAYLLPYIVTDLFGVFGLNLYWFGSGLPGAGWAGVLTMLLLLLVWILTRVQVRLRL
jgi:heparan-alpha-glucosaminide N-acetyltransferase